jgi:LmbE family N-acetylglucosaminyl deacetylase
VIAAHPDDEVLGCGGTIARLSDEGQKFFTLILGEGATSRGYSGKQARAAGKKLRAQAHRAGAVLGVEGFRFCAMPDNRFDELSLLDVVKKIEGVIDTVKPGIVFTHFGGDLNIDHRIAFEATLTAARPTAGCGVKELYLFEIPSSTEWSFGRIGGIFNPNVFFDISRYIGKKLEAMKKYAGEVRAFPHPRSSEAIEATARRWGSVAGVSQAEAFELVRRCV